MIGRFGLRIVEALYLWRQKDEEGEGGKKRCFFCGRLEPTSDNVT